MLALTWPSALQAGPVLVSPTGAQLRGMATYQDGDDHRPSNDPPDGCVGIDVPAPREGQPGITRSGELADQKRLVL